MKNFKFRLNGKEFEDRTIFEAEVIGEQVIVHWNTAEKEDEHTDYTIKYVTELLENKKWIPIDSLVVAEMVD